MSRWVGQVALVVAVAAAAAVGGLVLGSQLKTIDPAVQVALIGLFGVLVVALIGVGGVALGARIGADAAREVARAAQQEAQADREEARRSRFSDTIRLLATDLLRLGHEHMVEAEHAYQWWMTALGSPGIDPDNAPQVHSTAPMKPLAWGLYFAVHEGYAAQAAWDFFDATELVGKYTDFRGHIQPDGTSTRAGPGEGEHYIGLRIDWYAKRDRFVNAIRDDVGLPAVSMPSVESDDLHNW